MIDKKALICLAAAILSLTLSGCRVGPREEEPEEPPVVSESLPPDDIITNTLPVENVTVPTEPLTEPIVTETDVPDEEIAVDTEDVEEDEEDEEDELIRETADFDEIEPVELTADISLNVRRGPSTDYEAFGTISEGQRVTAIGEAYGWYVIEYRGQYGFVSGRYMSDEPPEDRTDESFEDGPEENGPENTEPLQTEDEETHETDSHVVQSDSSAGAQD